MSHTREELINRFLLVMDRLSAEEADGVRHGKGREFSPDEVMILDALAGGPMKLDALVEATGIERSKCSTLAGNLRAIKALHSGPGGYELPG